MSIDIHSGKIWPIVDSNGNGSFGMKPDTLEKLLSVVEAARSLTLTTSSTDPNLVGAIECRLTDALAALEEKGE